MKVHRYTLTLAAASAALSLVSTAPAYGQISDEAMVKIMRACSRIDDGATRLACYDDNMRNGGASAGTAATPVTRADAVESFGKEGIKTNDRFAPRSGENGVESISARVTSAQERLPGIWLITLDDGAEWLFSDSVKRTYRPPRRGSTIEIERASLGSFLMIVDRQQGVRVRRVK